MGKMMSLWNIFICTCNIWSSAPFTLYLNIKITFIRCVFSEATASVFVIAYRQNKVYWSQKALEKDDPLVTTVGFTLL